MILIVVLFVGMIISVKTQSNGGCLESSCTTFREINTLWCHTDPTYFCQCRPSADGSWIEQSMPCPRAGTFFSFKHQSCVREEMWTADDCGKQEDSGEDETDPDDGTLCTEPCLSYSDINKLWCYPEQRDVFCQCKPTREEGVFVAVRMPCALGTAFSFKRQTCVHNVLWADSCPV